MFGSARVQDHYDVKMPCHLLLSKLAGLAPSHVLAALQGLVDPMAATLTARVKSDAVKQEVMPPAEHAEHAEHAASCSPHCCTSWLRTLQSHRL